ncbi:MULTISPECIES: D-alanyl-D-alanine carboxypeptidase [unclassified Streptomyces]|uniref:D-alanyl-D-alanine carboxypeptidase n=1 Tax=Streptomyces sp. NEAU-sy36 TaxID=2751189 RepID=UPI00214C71B9|nr:MULTISPECIES: D-alanyl-D-alanine carboxypeptidase [unclassified Streptomyces]
MAGESPDRSKQRQSSAGATSGSAGSVPEARDPRLAVAREAGEKDSSNGGADTATKVLSVRAAEPLEEDTALNRAVSSWVRDADGAGKDSGAGAKDADEADGADGAGKDAAGAAAEGADEATEDGKGSGKDTGGPEEAEGTAQAGAGAEDDDAEADTGPKGAAPTSGAAEDADAASEEDAGDESGAKAEDVAGAESKDSKDATDATDSQDAKDAETVDGQEAEQRDGKAAEADAAGTAEAEDDDADVKASTDADAPAKNDAAKADADADTAADAESDRGSDAKSGTKNDDADAEASPAQAEDDADADADSDSDGDGDGGKEPRKPAAGGAGAKKAGAAAEAASAPAAGVDQPTTAFKAVKPKPGQIDQPTTMLKVGGKDRPAETDAERTSKFVALKDDVKAEAKPADEKTTAVPQVGPERTTQQPLPPKPPLDLLAELTNTPPPPETPVRTLVRRVKIWTPLVLLLVIIFAVVQALRPLPSPTLALTGKDSYTFDGGRVDLPWPNEGQGWMDVDGLGTMGDFGKQTPVAIGSVAKTMTAYIILRDHPLKPGQEGPKIKVDPTAEKEGGYSKSGESTLNTVKAGDHLTEKQALSAVMIPSANNIARLLARWDAGSEAAFVKKMNATAKELGMTGTTYTDPSGLKETTVSTAHDQVRLGRAVVKQPALVAITSAASWTDPTGHNWPNYNSLPYWVGAIGIKTGTTTAAGGNLLFAARKKVGGQTVTVVGAILGQHKPSILDTVNEVSKTALLGAEHALTSAQILKKGDVVGYVDDRLGGHTPIVVTRDVTAVGWSGLKVNLSFSSGTVPHTAKAGTEVGTLTVGDGTTAGVKVPVALARDLTEPGFGAKLTRLG